MSFDLTLRGTHGRPTKCKCPRCEKIHKAKMIWTGRGMPRVYCQMCIQANHHLSSGLDEGSQFNRRQFMAVSTQP